MRSSIDVRDLHPWDVSPREAVALQQSLRSLVVVRPAEGPESVRFVAGVDVHVPARLGSRAAVPATASDPTSAAAGAVGATAAVVVLSYPDLSVVEASTATLPVSFPYVPGLLSFRELPAVLAAFRALRTRPDLILCDGQGYAHPRRFGLACHLGVLTGIPTVGVAKTLLVGTHGPLAEERGSWEPIVDVGEVVGAAVRTRSAVKPVYVSVGHKVDVASAVEWTLRLSPRYRLPETTRQAHRIAGEVGRVR